MTMREMCEDIAAEIKRRGGPELDPIKDIFEYSPRGELGAVFEAYWNLFPERLPVDVPNPIAGSLRYNPEHGKIEMWMHGVWRQMNITESS